jgi:hypothetical protein
VDFSVSSKRLHRCSTNCLRRLSCASDVLFRDSNGTLKVRSQFVQTPRAGTVPNHLVTLRFGFAILSSLSLRVNEVLEKFQQGASPAVPPRGTQELFTKVVTGD